MWRSRHEATPVGGFCRTLSILALAD